MKDNGLLMKSHSKFDLSKSPSLASNLHSNSKPNKRYGR